MDCRDHREGRAALLLKSVEPELLRLLKNAPEYGSCGIDLVFHDSEIIRIGVRAEVTRKAKPRTGMKNLVYPPPDELAQEADRLLTGGKK